MFEVTGLILFFSLAISLGLWNGPMAQGLERILTKSTMGLYYKLAKYLTCLIIVSSFMVLLFNGGFGFSGMIDILFWISCILAGVIAGRKKVLQSRNHNGLKVVKYKTASSILFGSAVIYIFAVIFLKLLIVPLL